MEAKGKMRWLRQGRNKNDFNNDLPALIFVSGSMQALFNASPMDFIIGGHGPRVVVRLRPIVTSMFDVTIGLNLARTKTESFDPRPDRRPSVNVERPTTQRRQYLPWECPRERFTAVEALR